MKKITFILLFIFFTSLQSQKIIFTKKIRPIIFYSPAEELKKTAISKKERIPSGFIFRRKAQIDSILLWEFIGPMPIMDEFWSGYSFASGRVTSIVVHPNNPLIAYVGGAQGGIWKTIDGGANWIPLTDHISSLSTGAIAIDPSHPNTIYYGTGEQHFCGNCFYGDGLFKSTDGGLTWIKIANTTDVGSFISKIIVDPNNPDILHLGSDLGYLKSTDGGISWNLNLSLYWCTDIVMRPDSPSVLYCGIHTYGIYKSEDAGESWIHLTNGLPSTGFKRINMAISSSNPDIIYASFIANNGSLLGMYKTVNGGDNWVLLSNTPNYVGYQGWYDNCLIVDPSNSDIVYAGGVFPYDFGWYGVIKSTDGGNTWSDITIGIDGSQLHPDQHTFAFGPDGTLWVGNDGGVWKTADGGFHWINLNRKLGVTQFYTVAIHPYDSSFILGGTQDNGTVYYSGSTEWNQQNPGDGGPSLIEWDSPNIYYTTYVLLSIIFKWDNGNYMGNVAGPWENDRVSWCNAPLIVDPITPNTLLAGTHRVWKSTNGGFSWYTISGDLTNGGHLRALTIASDNSNIIYSGSSDGKVFLTLDGINWIPRDGGLFGNNPITDIWISPIDWKIAYLSVDRASGGRVYMTTDSGFTWIDLTGDLGDGLRGLSLGVDFRSSPPILYLGTDYGMYVSFNNGENWIKQDNVPNLAIYDIAVDTLNGVVIAATHGRGMWRAASPVEIKEYTEGFRKGIFLEISPNPVKEVAKIIYSIPKDKEIKLEIFNMLGQKVGVLENKRAGNNVFYWNAKRLSEGVYFIHLKSGKYDLRKPFVLIK